MPTRNAKKPGCGARGMPDGPRELTIWTHCETKAWRALAVEHEAARLRLNRLMPATPDWARERESHEKVEELGDYRELDNEVVRRAVNDYRAACAAFFNLPNLKPRHIPTLIRLAAEVAGAGDPLLSFAPAAPRDNVDLAWAALLSVSWRALFEAGQTRRGNRARTTKSRRTGSGHEHQ